MDLAVVVVVLDVAVGTNLATQEMNITGMCSLRLLAETSLNSDRHLPLANPAQVGACQTSIPK